MVSVRMLAPHDAQVLEHVAPGVFDDALDPRWTEQFLADPRHHMAVALDGGVVVGMASAVHYVHPDKGPQLWVNEVGVAPSHRRGGIATRLLATLFAHARALGCAEAWLGAEESNEAARRLYGSMGGKEAPVMHVTFGLGPVPACGFQDVLDFWFGPAELRGSPRPEWFRKDEEFDARIWRRFGALHAAAALGEREAWRGEAHSMLALVVVLDQFSRNLYRGDARAFAQDAHALACAREAVARGDDARLLPVERQFLYLPFEHSEDAADQDRAVELMHALDAFDETRGLERWAQSHRVIIRRFGRFPHRNAALGRVSTPEETEFLKEPGSGF